MPKVLMGPGPLATTTAAGQMSAADKIKLNGITAGAAVTDVQVNGTSVVSNGVANVPETLVVTITATESQGETVYSADKTFTEIETAIANGTTVVALYDTIWLNLVTAKIADITFSAVAGEGSPVLYKVTIFNNNSVSYEWSWLSDIYDVQVNGTSVTSNGVANVPIASTSAPGTIKVQNSNTTEALNNGGSVLINDVLYIVGGTAGQMKNGVDAAAIVSASRQHLSVFYGLARAAGDNTQSASNNAVGTYTSEAKAAIQTMLDVASTSDVSAKYTKPSGGIPASDLASGVIPDISGKADKLSSYTVGHIASIGTNGNLADSGYKPSDFQIYKFVYSIPANNGPVTMNYNSDTAVWYNELLLSDNARVVGYYATQWKYYKDIDVSFNSASSSCTMSVGVEILPGASAGTLELYIAETATRGA